MKKLNSQKKNLEAMRHSCSHVLAAAVKKLYPDVKFAIGPVIENGFYYDFEFKKPVSENDLSKAEQEMKKIIGLKLSFKKKDISIEEAKNLFKNQPYKLELIKEIALKNLPKKGAAALKIGRNSKVSIYAVGGFVDLCSGPHLESTGKIGPFKLLKIAGAYWRGDEKNKMLTRVYGTCFPTQKELDQYLFQLEEAKKRDHRKIGKELDLFSFHPEAPGDVFWHSKGLVIMHQLMKYWRQVHLREGYQEIRTPEILTRKIWAQSGHTKNYLEKMYRVLSPDAKEWDMAVKPMNCNGGMLVYKTKPKSYKEFPLKVGELGIVHRYESSGELHGIIRPREFTQDDAHIYCTPEQVKEELKKVIDLCFEIYEACGLKINHLELSTRPKKSIGSDEAWEKAETIMKQVLKEKKVAHQINEGDGAFYGPKFDFHLQDTLGRTWQCATIQLDFAQPENFNLEYITPQGTRQRPVMIHRTIYGSLERFIGILIENYAGAFPFWLAPIQVEIISIAERHQKYGKKILKKLLDEKVRAEIDNRSETMSAKIRDATLQKTPFMIIIGDKEIKKSLISIRTREGKDLGQKTLDQFLTKIKNKLEKKI